MKNNAVLQCSQRTPFPGGVGVVLLLTSTGGAIISDDFHDEGREANQRVATAQRGHVRRTDHVGATLLFRSVSFYSISRGQEGLRWTN